MATLEATPTANRTGSPLISVVVPCFNEAENLPELYRRLVEAFPHRVGPPAEFVLVNDASSDDTVGVLAGLHRTDPRVVPVHRADRGGQTRALWAGLQVARGDWIAHLDGDLQNDPADLPVMFRRATQSNLDAVLGYRAHRRDKLSRRLASGFANSIRRAILGDTIRDIGCSTRVVRRAVLQQIPPVENQHRYLGALIEGGGWRLEQIPAKHHPRAHGRSKYGNLSRGLAGLRDLPRMSRLLRELHRQANRRDET